MTTPCWQATRSAISPRTDMRTSAWSTGHWQTVTGRKRGAQGAETAGAGLVSLEFHETELNVRGGKSVISRVLADGAPPSALLCFSDVIALGVYFGLAEAGKRIPQDMSVMGFDNLDWAVETVPPLTTIDLPAAEMGRAAARQIIENLEDGTKLQPQFLPAQIIERGSVLTV